MIRRKTENGRVRLAVWLLAFACLLYTVPAAAQTGQNGQNGTGTAQQGNNLAGIEIDVAGTIKPVFVSAVADKLNRERLKALAGEHLPEDVNRPSEQRHISLVQLEAACAELLGRGEEIPVEMRFLGGLQRIDYVFVYPETGDLVIAGPAEGFADDGTGRVLGASTGRPVVRLDDLIVVLRSVSRSSLIGCSIDAEPDRLRQTQQFVRQNSSPASPAVAQRRYQQIARLLGMQNVSIFGVPPDSHFARVLVEADYRMKLVSMGLEACSVPGFRSHLSVLQPRGNSMQRWWFTPLYEPFYRTQDGNAYQISGQRAQLCAQEEIADAAGRRHDAATTRITTTAYARHFTDKFPEIAENKPVFAELQNVFDLAILAALMQKQSLPQRIGWSMSLFLDAGRMPHEPGTVPKQVPSVTNCKFANRRMIIGLVGGGVEVRPVELSRAIQFASAPDARLSDALTRASESQPRDRSTHPWWWD